MKRIYKLLLMSACGLFGLQAYAQQISVEEAQAKALSFLNGQVEAKTRRVKSNLSSLELAYTAKNGSEKHFYVFNSTTSDGGYVIIGGDEAAHEILGYSEKGSFDYAAIPENMKWWLSQYSIQIHEAIADVKAGKAIINDEAKRNQAKRKAKANIDYLMTTEWDQVAPFNSQIPLYAQGFTGQSALATGCVATAGAQVMKYYEWPDCGIGSKTLNRTFNGVTFSADFANTQYDWANMKDKYAYDKYDGSAADIAVGTLMYHIGVAVDMNYGQLNDGGSSASTQTLARRLADTFKYDKSIMYKNRSSYTNEAWEDMIYAELQEHRPVLYSGTSDAPNGGGHAFVCDGYKDGRFHINWGWNGSNNNYFLLTATSTEKALQPNGTGSGGSAANSSYCLNQAVVINIKPDYNGTSKPTREVRCGEYTLPASVVAKGARTYINGYMFNNGLFADTFEFAVKLVNTNDESDTHIVESSNVFDMNVNQGKGYVYYNIPNDVKYGESYYVYPMFKNDNNEWQVTDMPLDFVVPSLTIATPTGLNTEEFAISNNGYVSKESFNISLDIKNWDNSAVNPSIVLWVFPSGGGSNVDYINLGKVSLKPNESNHFDLTFNNFHNKNRFVVGNKYYIMAYNDNSGSYISKKMYFTFCNDLSIDYTMTAAGWGTICLPFEAEVPSGLTAYNVTSINGKYLVKEEVDKLEMNTPYLLSGDEGTYTFEGPDTPVGSNYKNGVLVGNTAPSDANSYVYAPKDSYVLQNNNGKLGFYKVADDNIQKVRQYSAYVAAPSNGNSYAASLMLGDDDEATEIETIQEITNDAPAYNLNGIRVNNNAKGFIIVNGKLIYKK